MVTKYAHCRAEGFSSFSKSFISRMGNLGRWRFDTETLLQVHAHLGGTVVLKRQLKLLHLADGSLGRWRFDTETLLQVHAPPGGTVVVKKQDKA